MNIGRKIQIAAGAVIVNGVAALSLMSPLPAQAASCSGKILCNDLFCRTPESAQAACNFFIEPGCVLTSWECLDAGFCDFGVTDLYCTYAPA